MNFPAAGVRAWIASSAVGRLDRVPPLLVTRVGLPVPGSAARSQWWLLQTFVVLLQNGESVHDDDLHPVGDAPLVELVHIRQPNQPDPDDEGEGE